MPKTLAERTAILQQFLFDAWLSKAGIDRDSWLAFEHGVPVEWAEAIEQITDGALKVSDWPRVIHAPKLLHGSSQKSIVKSNEMHAAQKLAISQGRTDDDDKFADKIQAAGFTQASLAKAVGMTESLLSMCKNGKRAMYLSRAQTIEKLTGYRATRANWRGGLVQDTES